MPKLNLASIKPRLAALPRSPRVLAEALLARRVEAEAGALGRAPGSLHAEHPTLASKTKWALFDPLSFVETPEARRASPPYEPVKFFGIQPDLFEHYGRLVDEIDGGPWKAFSEATNARGATRRHPGQSRAMVLLGNLGFKIGERVSPTDPRVVMFDRFTEGSVYGVRLPFLTRRSKAYDSEGKYLRPGKTAPSVPPAPATLKNAVLATLEIAPLTMGAALYEILKRLGPRGGRIARMMTGASEFQFDERTAQAHPRNVLAFTAGMWYGVKRRRREFLEAQRGQLKEEDPKRFDPSWTEEFYFPSILGVSEQPLEKLPPPPAGWEGPKRY